MDNQDFKVNTGEGAPPGGGIPQPPKFPVPPPIPPRPSVASSEGGPRPSVTSSEGGPRPSTPSVPPVSPIVSSQPDFISQESLGASPIPEGAQGIGGGGRGLFKTILAIFLTLVIVGGVGSLAYFVIFPVLFPEDLEIPPPAPTVQQKASHQSYLQLPPAAESEIKLSDKKYSTIITAVQNEAFAQLADGQVKEIKISDDNGQVPFGDFISSLTSAAGAIGLGDWLEKDFTAVLYYNPAGVWPVYVAKLKSGIDSKIVASGFQSLEGVAELGNFYLTSPGSFAGFKDGNYQGYATRYNVGSVLGASFNYGIFGDYLVIATNFDALKATLSLLGL